MSWQLASVLLGLFALTGWCYWIERRYPEQVTPDVDVKIVPGTETYLDLQTGTVRNLMDDFGPPSSDVETCIRRKSPV
jgi:hypothetical protein